MPSRNAPLTGTGRLRLARCVVQDGWPLRRAARRARPGPRCRNPAPGQARRGHRSSAAVRHPSGPEMAARAVTRSARSWPWSTSSAHRSTSARSDAGATSAATGSSMTAAAIAATRAITGRRSVQNPGSSRPRSRTGGHSVVRCRSTSAAVGSRPASRTVPDAHPISGARCRTARQRPSARPCANMTGAASANAALAPARHRGRDAVRCAQGRDAARSAAGPTGPRCPARRARAACRQRHQGRAETVEVCHPVRPIQLWDRR